MNGFEPRFIELAAHVNERMPEYVLELITEALNRQSKSVRDSHIHVLGVAYKRGVSDCRESPSLAVMKLLHEPRREALATATPTSPSSGGGARARLAAGPRRGRQRLRLRRHPDRPPRLRLRATSRSTARSIVDARNAHARRPGRSHHPSVDASMIRRPAPRTSSSSSSTRLRGDRLSYARPRAGDVAPARRAGAGGDGVPDGHLAGGVDAAEPRVDLHRNVSGRGTASTARTRTSTRR